MCGYDCPFCIDIYNTIVIVFLCFSSSPFYIFIFILFLWMYKQFSHRSPAYNICHDIILPLLISQASQNCRIGKEKNVFSGLDNNRIYSQISFFVVLIFFPSFFVCCFSYMIYSTIITYKLRKHYIQNTEWTSLITSFFIYKGYKNVRILNDYYWADSV